MRSFVIAIFIFGTILCGLLYSHDYINTSTRGDMEILQVLYSAVEREEWSVAEIKLEEIKVKREKENHIMSAMLEHTEMDAVSQKVKSLEQYIKRREVSDSMSESAQALFLLERLGQKYRFNIANLF